MRCFQLETRKIFKKDRWHNLEIDYFSMVCIHAIRVRLAVAALVDSVIINRQANMAAGAPLNKRGHTFYQSQITLDSF